MSAKQKGILPLQGSVGEITFFRSNGEYRVRRRNAHTRERIMHDPAFVRFREHLSEFAGVIAAGRLIGNAIAPLTTIVKDSSMRNRLTSRLYQVAKSDRTNRRGQRNILDGDLGLLRQFEMGGRSLHQVLPVHWAARLNAPEGKAAVSLPAMIPDRLFAEIRDASHFQLHSALVALDFEKRSWQLDHRCTAPLPISRWMVPAQQLAVRCAAAPGDLLLLFFGIDFHLYTNGFYDPLKNRLQNCMQVVAASRVAATVPAIESPAPALPAANAGGVAELCRPATYGWHSFRRLE